MSLLKLKFPTSHVFGIALLVLGLSSFMLIAPNQSSAATTTAQIQKTFDVDGGFISQVVEKNNIAYVSGQFTSIEGQARNGLAAVDLSNNTVTSWDPLAGQSAVSISKLAINGDNLLIGGNFSAFGGAARTSLAEVTLANGSLSSFDVPVQTDSNGTLAPGTVRDIDVQDGVITLGGSFNRVSNDTRVGLARVNYSATAPTISAQTFNLQNAAADGSARHFARLDNVLYVTGNFTDAGGVLRRGVVAITDAGNITAFNPPLYPTVANGDPIFSEASIVASGDQVFVGEADPTNTTKKALPADRVGVAAFDKTSGALTDWNADLALSDTKNVPSLTDKGFALDLKVRDNVLYIAGLYDTVRGKTGYNGFAAIDLSNNSLLDVSGFKVPNEFTPASPNPLAYFATIAPAGNSIISTFVVFNIDSNGAVTDQRYYSSRLEAYARPGTPPIPDQAPVVTNPPKVDPPQVAPPVELPKNTKVALFDRLLLKTNGKFRFYSSEKSTAQIWVRRRTSVNGKLVYRDVKVLRDVPVRDGGTNVLISKYLKRQGVYRIVIRDAKVGSPKESVSKRVTKLGENKFRLKKF